MTQHTPGPWVIRGPDRLAICQGDHRGTFVAEAHRAQNSRAQANARLIAAAPDLLATLQGTIGILEYGVGTRGWNIEADRIAAKVRAAIAKATGTDETRE